MGKKGGGKGRSGGSGGNILGLLSSLLGGGGGGQWRKGGGKGRKGKGGAKWTKFGDLSEEKKDEIRAKRAEKAAEEGRSVVGNVFYQGTLVKRRKGNGWIKPKNLA